MEHTARPKNLAIRSWRKLWVLPLSIKRQSSCEPMCPQIRKVWGMERPTMALRLTVGVMSKESAGEVGYGVRSGGEVRGGDGWNNSTSGQRPSSPSWPSNTRSFLWHLWPRWNFSSQQKQRPFSRWICCSTIDNRLIGIVAGKGRTGDKIWLEEEFGIGKCLVGGYLLKELYLSSWSLANPIAWYKDSG